MPLPPVVLAERGSTADVATAPDLETRAEAVVVRSRELGQALETRQAEAAEQRELADAQLLAAAALDLQIAIGLSQLGSLGNRRG